jgi:hypothetical protein
MSVRCRQRHLLAHDGIVALEFLGVDGALRVSGIAAASAAA